MPSFTFSKNPLYEITTQSDALLSKAIIYKLESVLS